MQHLESGGEPVYQHVAALAERLNASGNVGLVVGATAPTEVADVRRVSQLPFLLPGVGAQGGDVEAAVRAPWNGDPASCLVSPSRSVVDGTRPARQTAALNARVNG